MGGGAVGAFAVPTDKMQPLTHGPKVLVVVVVVGVGVGTGVAESGTVPSGLSDTALPSLETCTLIISMGPLQKFFAAE